MMGDPEIYYCAVTVLSLSVERVRAVIPFLPHGERLVFHDQASGANFAAIQALSFLNPCSVHLSAVSWEQP